jgi:hypothetical protein
MARFFTSASAEYLTNGMAVRGITPCTMACWFYSVSASAAQCLMSCCTAGSDNQRHGIFLRVSGGVPVALGATSRTTSESSSSGGTWVLNQWQHGCGVFAANAWRQAWLNGVPGNPQATNRAISGLNQTNIGRNNSSTTDYMNGMIAEAAMWVIALSRLDIEALAKGVSPLMIRPEYLAGYWPILGQSTLEPDWAPTTRNHLRKNNMALVGTAPFKGHAPIKGMAFNRLFWQARNQPTIELAPSTPISFTKGHTFRSSVFNNSVFNK